MSELRKETQNFVNHLAKVAEAQRIVISDEDFEDFILEEFADLTPNIENSSNSQSTTNEEGEFCVLCLRQATPDHLISFSNYPSQSIPDAREAARVIQHTTGIKLTLSTVSKVCRTCWTLAKMIMDFRECCLQATSWMDLFSKGLEVDGTEEDHWFSTNTLDVIGWIHKAVQENVVRVEQAKEVKINELISCSTKRNATQSNLEPTVDDFDDLWNTNVSGEIKTEEFIIEDSNDVNDLYESDQVEDTLSDDHDDEGEENSDDWEINEKLKDQSRKRPERKAKQHHTNFDEAIVLEKDHLIVNILTCTECGRKFDGRKALRMHGKTCSGSESSTKYHTCPICSATFVSARCLIYHINKHKGIKPYKCRKYCDNTYASDAIRLRHEKYACQPEGRVCPVCGTMLKNESCLQVHIAVVHGEATHECEICNKKFRGSRLLRGHMAVHSDERKYPCKMCDKAFKSSYAAKTHRRLHTQEKPHACQLCDQAFSSRPALKAHLDRYHGRLE